MKNSFPDLDSWSREVIQMLIRSGYDNYMAERLTDQWLEDCPEEWNCTTPDQAAEQIKEADCH